MNTVHAIAPMTATMTATMTIRAELFAPVAVLCANDIVVAAKVGDVAIKLAAGHMT